MLLMHMFRVKIFLKQQQLTRGIWHFSDGNSDENAYVI